MAGRRAERVGRQVVQALAAIAESGVHDPRLGGITFTSAAATDDLRTVRVFFSLFSDDPAVVAAAREGLKKAAGFLRRELAQRLSLRYVPSLIFEYDQSLHTAGRIEQLLREERPDGERPGDPPADPWTDEEWTEGLETDHTIEDQKIEDQDSEDQEN